MSQVFRGILALGFFLLALPTVEAQQWARDMFEETAHDFGMVASNGKFALRPLKRGCGSMRLPLMTKA